MLVVGITGGIGSGKSVVCQVFSALGIPVFKSDEAARYLMENDVTLVRYLSLLLGADVYDNGKLNRPRVSEIIYHNPEKLKEVNELVHPATVNYSRQWLAQQVSPYVIKEAAIFFESGTYTEIDVMIEVYAPAELRVQRAMVRSSLSRAQVLAIISQQMDEEEKMKRCDYVIVNDDVTAVLPQVLQLHQQLLLSCSSRGKQ
jgi:dephospho-CoA kinase